MLALAVPADAAGTTINVNPVSGNDANPGSTAQPLKTLTKALSKAKAGDTVKLAPGGYGPGGQSAEQIPADGLRVPAGVTIDGATDAGFPISTLVGPGTGAGLNLTGNATVRDLALGGQGFGVALYAKQGKQTFSNVLLATASGRQAVIDGQPFSAGIVLRGSALATLNASTLFVNGATGVAVGQQARLTVRGGEVKLAGSANNGVFVADQGVVTMDGGRITGGAPTCDTDANGLALRDEAQAVLKNGARLENVPGTGMLMHETAKATLGAVTITRVNGAGCGRASIDARGSASLVADGTRIAAAGGQNIVGISTQDAVTVQLKNTAVQDHTGPGIDLNGNESLIVDASSITSNGIGVEARTPSGGSGGEPTPHIKITGTSLARNTIGIQVDEPILKLRNRKVIFNETGVEVLGPVGGLPVGDDCFFACVNLGLGTDPGNNTFVGNTDTAVRFRPTFDPKKNIAGVPAMGNAWNANTQGANGGGLYTTPLTVRAANGTADPLASGKNFVLPLGSNTVIQLADDSVGTFKLSPRTLTARPGRTARLRLAWTHPVDWKRLDRVVLRLESRGKPVGRVVLDQETNRLRASGPAVRLVPGRSAVSAKAGAKRVTATLALRIAKRYAGRTLVAKLAASDDNGNRQAFRRAGRVRLLSR